MTKTKKKTEQKIHLTRLILAVILVLSVTLTYLAVSDFPSLVANQKNTHATSKINRQDLLDITNNMRNANGLENLNISEKLNMSAQAKAEDMVKHNYWSHSSPDGKQPWSFMQKVGYDYNGAAENLAYGFLSSEEVINAWINSQDHKKAVLGDFSETGFGIANGANFQGGKNIVIVAHYARPTPKVLSQITKDSNTAPITVLDHIRIGLVHPATAISLILITLSIPTYAIVHRKLIRQNMRKGTKPKAIHPIVDLSLITAALTVVLSMTIPKLL